MENVDVAKRKHFWTEVKKSSLPKRKHVLEREKNKQKPTFEQILATSVPKKNLKTKKALQITYMNRKQVWN